MASDRTIQISGLASGVDTAAMVDKLIAVESRPIDKMEENQELLRMEKTALQEVSSRFRTMQDSMSTLRLSATFMSRTTESSDSQVVSASADSTANNGTYILENIQIATPTRVTSLQEINSTENTNAIKASAGSVVTGAGFAGTGVLNTTQTFANAGFDGQINDGSIVINGVGFAIDADVTTVDDFLSLVNASDHANVVMAYDPVADGFVIVSKDSGSASQVAITDSSTGLMEEANININSTTYGAGTINPESNLRNVTVGTNTSFLPDVNLSTPLTDLNGGAGVDWGFIRITDRSGASAQIDLTSVNTVNDVIEAINGAGLNVTIRIDDTKSAFFLEDSTVSPTSNMIVEGTAGTTAADLGIGDIDDDDSTITSSLLNPQLSFKINGMAFKYDTTETSLNEVLSDINNSGTKVKAGYDPDNDRITMTSESGYHPIVLEDISGDFMSNMNLLQSTSGYIDTQITSTSSAIISVTQKANNVTPDTYTIEFTALDRYQISSERTGQVFAEGIPYVSGMNNQLSIGGLSFRVSDGPTGTKEPQIGDKFAVTVSGRYTGELLSDLNSGNGVGAGSILITTADNSSATVDLSSALNIYDVLTAINDSGLAVSASIDTLSGGIQLIDSSGGNTVDFSVAEVSGGSTAADLGILKSSNFPLIDGNDLDPFYYQDGQNASFELNGVTRTKDSNNFTIDGIAYELYDNNTNPITITVDSDVEKATEAVEDFLTKFNDMIVFLNPLPLSDEEKKFLVQLDDDSSLKMTFAEIDNWNENYEIYHTREIIRKDSSLSRLRTEMMRIAFDNVADLAAGATITNITNIGITTGKPGMTVSMVMESTLSITDSTVFEDAIRNNPDDVYNLFANSGTFESNVPDNWNDMTDFQQNQYELATIDDGDGVSRKFYKFIRGIVNYGGIIERRTVANGTIDRKISRYDDDIIDYQGRLDSMRARYELQFAHMETMLSSLQAESDWLAAEISKL